MSLEVACVVVPLFTLALAATAMAVSLMRQPVGYSRVPALFILLNPAWWLLCNAAQIANPDLSSKLFWDFCAEFSVSSMAPALLFFALQFAGMDRWLNKRAIALLALEPMAMIVGLATNRSHGLVWSAVALDASGPISYLVREPAWGYWVHIGINYALLFAATYFMATPRMHGHRFSGGQIRAMLMGLTPPWALHIADVFGLNPLPGVEWTAVAAAAAAIILSAVYRNLRNEDTISDSLQAAWGAMGDGLVLVDKCGTVIRMNPAAERIVGVDACEAVGSSIGDLWPHFRELAGDRCIWGNAEESRFEVAVVRGNEKTRWIDTRISPVLNWHGRPMSGAVSFRDVTDRKRLEMALQARLEEAKERARQDPLTGILNHRALHERLEEETKRAQSLGQPCSFLIADIDDFKMLNDTYGHIAGDRALVNIARVLESIARGSDSVGRYGGDEYSVVLPDTDSEGAMAWASQLRQALRDKPFETPDGILVPIRVSIGVATYPEDARSPEELVARADIGLYHSKRMGGNSITTTRDGQGGQKQAVCGHFGMLEGLVTAVDNKDRYTRQHSEEVSEYAGIMARALGLSDETRRTLRIAAILHDLGKIGIPDHILRKPGRLTEEEYSIVKQHPLLAEVIIKEVPNVGDVITAVGAHHERVDGNGYPRGLAGDRIPFLGRILAVADTYSALTTDRPYRKAMGRMEAESELRRVAGTQLDADLVELFLNALPLEVSRETCKAS